MKIIEKLQTIINSNVHQILDPSAVQAAQEAIDEIERLRAENALQHSQLLEQAINVLPDRDATIERLRKELNRTIIDRNNQLDRLRAAAGDAERLRARVAELEARQGEIV